MVFIKKNHLIISLLCGILLTIPILIFLFPIISSGPNTILPGDYDMQVQMTEAARKTILEYKQFPWFNPWVSGGVPLFADPQFGLFSAQTLFALLFGSIIGWKIYIVLVFIVGFFGFAKLLKYLAKPNNKVDLLWLYVLSYAWIMNSFFVLRSGGHLTFMLLHLLPWVLYFYFSRDRSKKLNLLLISTLVYLIYSAVHYPTIIIFIVLLFFYTYDFLLLALIHKDKKRTLIKHIKFGIYTFGSVFILSIPRIVFTLEYLTRNSVKRLVYEKFIGFKEVFVSIFTPPKLNLAAPNHYTWGPFEASAYSGILIFVFLIILFVFASFKFKKINKINPYIFPITYLSIISVAIGSGGVLFWILQKFPIFSSMRVSTRWFFVATTSFILLLYIGLNIYAKRLTLLKTWAMIVMAIVFFVEVFAFNGMLLRDVWDKNKLVLIYDVQNNSSETIEQEALWAPNNEISTNDKLKITYFALTQATMLNKGQVIADNALVDTRFILTNRCDKDEIGCGFITSNNGVVTYWSPNKIIINRTAPGEIKINVNLGRHWSINSRDVDNNKLVDTVNSLTIPDNNSQTYILTYNPLLNP